MFIPIWESFSFVFCHVTPFPGQCFAGPSPCQTSEPSSDSSVSRGSRPFSFPFLCSQPPGSFLSFEFTRGVSADGDKFDHIRAFSLPPNFATFGSDEKVNYLASLLEGLAPGTAEQFSVVHQSIASQPCSCSGEVECESVDERLNAIKDAFRNEIDKMNWRM